MTLAPRRSTVPVLLVLALAWLAAPPPATAQSDQLTWGVHISLAPTWFDPAETSGMITPFMISTRCTTPCEAAARPAAGARPRRVVDRLQGRPQPRVRPPQGRPIPQRRSGDGRGREVLLRALPRRRLARRSRSAWRRWKSSDPGRVRFRLKRPWPDFLNFYATRHRGRLDRAEEVRREGRRRGLQEGARRRRALPVRLVHARASSSCWRRSTATGARRPASSGWSSRSIPDEATRLAALKRGEVDIVYSIRGALAEELRRTAGLKLKPRSLPGHVLALLPRPVGRQVALARPAGAPGREPRHRPPGHQPGGDARLLPDPQQHHPRQLRVLLEAAGGRPRPGPGAAAPRRGRLPNGFDAGDYFCDTSYANLGEAVLNDLQAVGIRARLRPLERAAFFSG